MADHPLQNLAEPFEVLDLSRKRHHLLAVPADQFVAEPRAVVSGEDIGPPIGDDFERINIGQWACLLLVGLHGGYAALSSRRSKASSSFERRAQTTAPTLK